MSSAHLQLAAKGQEDRWLSESPDRTYFEAKYQPRVNRSRETYEVPLDNQGTTFGMTGRCTIPVKGDYLTRLTLRAVFPPIYPTVEGEYVYPTPSSQVGASVYANMGLTLVVADGVTLTANTVGNHYMSIGAAVTLSGTAYRIFDLDGTYTVTSIPTANSFTCSTTLAGISYNGTMSFVGIACGDIISYFSTRNSNLWVNNLTNKTWQITNAVFNETGTELTVTTSTSSGFVVGQKVRIVVKSLTLDDIYTVIESSDTNFKVGFNKVIVVALSLYGLLSISSSTNGVSWSRSPGSVQTGGYFFNSVAFGNGLFLALDLNTSQVIRSTDNGYSWTYLETLPPDYSYTKLSYGNGVFMASGYAGAAYSTDNGNTWTPISIPDSDYFGNIVFGNGVFIAAGGYAHPPLYSTDGISWTSTASIARGYCAAFGNNTFVVVNYNEAFYSDDNGQTWTSSGVDSLYFNEYVSVAFGNNTFVTCSNKGVVMSYSTDNGRTWNSTSGLFAAYQITFANNAFVAVGEYKSMYSYDGIYWINGNPPQEIWGCVTSGITQNVSIALTDIVYLEPPPLVVTATHTQFQFSSDVYPSISFANKNDAAFWGFDARNGLTYSTPAIPPWTFTQGGWISGFLPPSLSTWDDSVAHKLVRDARILVGKQTIKEYTGEYIELQNDLTVPYENKAILKLLNGTLDQTQATVAREYYTTLPLGTKEIPLCALTHQQMSVEVDFESFTNLSQNLNPGTGDFLNPQSYTTYDASTGLLNGEPINVQTTFSYQQYIFIVTYGGQFIVYDTTKDVADPTSYIVLSAFAGTSLFSQFCVLSGILYIGLSDGKLLSIIIDELIQGNISSSVLNNYAPTIGTLTGTIVADFRYLYYTVINTATSNVFLTRYDTTESFTNPSSYTTFNFTSNIDSTATSVYQILSTGSQLVLLTNTPTKFYIFNLNANFTLSWNPVYYIGFAYQITSGVIIGTTIYFIGDSYSIISFSNEFFSVHLLMSTFVAFNQSGVSSFTYSNKISWVPGGSEYGQGVKLAYGNNTFVGISFYTKVASHPVYSNDNGLTWSVGNAPPAPGYWWGIAFGNNTFVATNVKFYNDDSNQSIYSTDNGRTWTLSQSGAGGLSVAFGNDTFVSVGEYNTFYSTDSGRTWTEVSTPYNYWLGVTFGNNTFVGVGYSGTYYSVDNGSTWVLSSSGRNSVAFGNDTFVSVGNGIASYSIDNGRTWSNSVYVPPNEWAGVTFGNGKFVVVGNSFYSLYSIDNGLTWNTEPIIPGFWNDISFGDTGIVSIPGDGIQNLHAVGPKIYASSNSSSLSSVIEIDTSGDLNSPTAYKYYSSTDSTAPITFDGTAPKIFANGPRFVYMFTQGNSAAQDVIRFDPYPPVPLLKTSILVDYESLPPEVPKPDKALLGLVQTQKVTDMNYMNIRGPVKELWVTGASDSANVFQYSNLADQSTLALTAGEEIITDDVGTRTFLNTIEPFETHTSMPLRNVSVIPFELDPESEIPNGTVNFSRIRDQVFNGGAETVWARTYNLLAIQGGIGGLIFNS